jgi:hypothetical protein
VQVYNDPGTGPLAFCELEAHAPSVRLEPGARQSFSLDMLFAFGDSAEVAAHARRLVAPSLTDADL